MEKKLSSFDELRTISRNGEYVLNNDIDCKGIKIPCIAEDFSGTLDGNGHVIRNLVITDDVWGDDQWIALFYSMSRAKITNITFENLQIIYDDSVYSPRVAALTGECDNCLIQGVSINVTSSSKRNIPMIYSTNGSKELNNSYCCNGKEG